jgi:hypothetical protein
MFANDIGMNHIEEINIVRNGGNYGWMKREGYWENGMIRPGAAPSRPWRPRRPVRPGPPFPGSCGRSPTPTRSSPR